MVGSEKEEREGMKGKTVMMEDEEIGDGREEHRKETEGVISKKD